MLTASRWPIKTVVKPSEFEVPYLERVLAVVIDLEGEPLELINTHVPDGSGHGWRKVEHFEGLYRYVARTWSPSHSPRLLCGDFNSPRLELSDGTVYTWAQTEQGRLRTRRGQRWDAAERSVILGLKAFDLHDAYRTRHGYGAGTEAVSWAARRGGREFGRRLDHIFASEPLRLRDCGYLEEWRQGEDRLSDHAPIWAEFDWP